MSQQDVYNLLKKTKKWMTAKEIGEELNVNRTNISTNLSKIFKYDRELKRREAKKGKNKIFSYEWKLIEGGKK